MQHRKLCCTGSYTVLCPNCWTVSRASSQSILDNLAVSQQLQDQSQQFLKFKQEFLEFLELFLWSLRSFTWVYWWYLPSTDISCRPHFRYFLPSFLCCYLFSKCNIHFFILVFSDPTSLLFSVFLFLCSTFPVFYFLPSSSVCLSLHILNFLFLSCLSFTFCPAAFYLSTLNFLCLSSNFSFCFYLFLCLLLSFFAFFHFHSLPVFYSIPLTPYSSFYLFLHLCVCFVVVIIIIIAIIIFILLFFFFLIFLPIF